MHISYFENFETTIKYTYIHVPKTGGSSIIKFLNNYSEYFDCSSHILHNIVATTFNRPILCIREPIDRIKSQYKYWRQHKEFYTDKTSFKHFINLLKNNSNDLFVENNTITEYHYFPQYYYIDPSVYKYAVILAYDKDTMNDKVNQLISYLLIPNRSIELQKDNVSVEIDNIEIDNEDMDFILTIYKNDFQLWDDLKNKPELFLKVI
jgi:hypothetical protein